MNSRVLYVDIKNLFDVFNRSNNDFNIDTDRLSIQWQADRNQHAKIQFSKNKNMDLKRLTFCIVQAPEPGTWYLEES